VTPSPESAKRTDSYFICGTPRTGSSLLLGLLESTAVAGRPQAYFREPDEQLWAEKWRIPRTAEGTFRYPDFVQAALAAGRTGSGVFGAKLMWGTLGELVDKLSTLHPELACEDAELLNRAFGLTRFVHLRREDVLAQAVSWLRAEQTNAWYVGGHGEIGGAAPDGGEPVFDADRIGELVRMAGEHNAAWEEWFASFGIEPYMVTYEELDADNVGVTLGILDFLGLELPAGRTVVPYHRRQADVLNSQWIDRCRAESTGP
jgi:LPS sulfotransferase NodH